MAERIYTASSGTTAYVNGERGIVRGFHYAGGLGRIAGAFVRLDERDATVFVEFGPVAEEPWREVVAAREVSRDEFDRIVGIDQIRADFGWAA
jgi:hypothetical protein